MSVTGRLSDRVQVGADVSYVNDRNIHRQTPDSQASSANVAFLAQSGGLPDVTFRDLRWKFYGKHALAKNSDIRVDLVHARSRLNEWTWGTNAAPFLLSDNTTVRLTNPERNVTFVGVRYVYRWQ